MHCEWSNVWTASALVNIEWYVKKGSQVINTPYDLVILKTLQSSQKKAVFNVTSYNVGNYNTGFKLVSNNKKIHIHPLTWVTNSVIPPKQKTTIKPYPPYGLWQLSPSVWYVPLIGIVVLSAIVFAVLKIRSLIKIKKTKLKVYKRLQNKKPLREFISQLNLLARTLSTPHFIKTVDQVKKAFELFLENQFFISAVNKTPQQILKQLKKYYPVIYKECDIFNFFLEIQKLSLENFNTKDAEWLLNKARDKAILCTQKSKEGK